VQLRSEQFQSSLKYTDGINPSMKSSIINIMNSVREKRTSYQRVYRWILSIIFNTVFYAVYTNDMSLFFFLTIIPLIYTTGEYFINKINCNLFIKIFLQCFCLYLLIFRQWSVFNGVLLWTRHYFSLWALGKPTDVL
jgi:hypothetical protein